MVSAVTGWGIRVPGADDVGTLWSSLLAGRCAGSIETFAELPYRQRVAVARPSASVGEGRDERFVSLGMAAVADALDGHPRYDTIDPARRAVVVATAFGPLEGVVRTTVERTTSGMGVIGPRTIPGLMTNALAAAISRAHDVEGPAYTVSTACASGTDALGLGHQMVELGVADLVIVCGADAAISLEVLAGFQRLSALSSETADPSIACRPFDRDRTGFMMGDGAACVVLEPDRGMDRRGTVLGYGASSDAYHVVAPRVDGAGAARAIRVAVEQGHRSFDQIGHVNAHGTGTALNDRAESAAINDVIGALVPTWSLKGAIGHLMGAAGIVEAIASWSALREGMVPPTVGCREPDPALAPISVVHSAPLAHDHDCAISNSFAFGGHNACVLLGR